MSRNSRICLVQLVEERVNVLMRSDHMQANILTVDYSQVTVIGVYRKREGEGESRRYRPYRYRSGLRHQRYLKILGRHGSTGSADMERING